MGSKSFTTIDASDKNWEDNNASTNQASGSQNQFDLAHMNAGYGNAITLQTTDSGSIAGAFSLAEATGQHQADSFGKLLDTFKGSFDSLRTAQTDAYNRAAGTVGNAMSTIQAVANTSRDGMSPTTVGLIAAALVGLVLIARK